MCWERVLAVLVPGTRQIRTPASRLNNDVRFCRAATGTGLQFGTNATKNSNIIFVLVVFANVRLVVCCVQTPRLSEREIASQGCVFAKPAFSLKEFNKDGFPFSKNAFWRLGARRCAQRNHGAFAHCTQRPRNAEVRQAAPWVGSEQRELHSHTNLRLIRYTFEYETGVVWRLMFLTKIWAAWRTGNDPDRDGGPALDGPTRHGRGWGARKSCRVPKDTRTAMTRGPQLPVSVPHLGEQGQRNP